MQKEIAMILMLGLLSGSPCAADGLQEKTLFVGELGFFVTADVSPDGRYASVLEWVDGGESGAGNRVYVIDLENHEVRALEEIFSSGYSMHVTSWSGDSQLLFSGNSGEANSQFLCGPIIKWRPNEDGVSTLAKPRGGCFADFISSADGRMMLALEVSRSWQEKVAKRLPFQNVPMDSELSVYDLDTGGSQRLDRDVEIGNLAFLKSGEPVYLKGNEVIVRSEKADSEMRFVVKGRVPLVTWPGNEGDLYVLMKRRVFASDGDHRGGRKNCNSAMARRLRVIDTSFGV